MADEKQIKGAIQPALLGALPTGTLAKTSRVFAVLQGGHFSLGVTNQGGVRKAIFNIPSGEADSACAAIVGMLKAKVKRPLAQLGRAERARTIEAALRPTSLSHRLAIPGTTTIGGQKKVGPIVVLEHRNTPTTTPCRYFEINKWCRFGDSCRFTHHDTRTSTNRNTQPTNPSKRSTSLPENPGTRNPHRQVRTVTLRENRGRSDPKPVSRHQHHSKDPYSPTILRRDSAQKDPVENRHSGEQRKNRPARKVRQQIKVKCRIPLHPVSWRESLRSSDKIAHSLVTWVERDRSDDNWVLVECEPGDVSYLIERLQKQKFDVRRIPEQSETRKKQGVRHENRVENEKEARPVRSNY